MKEKEINELHSILLKWLENKNKTPTDAIAFLTASWVGQMCLNGYTENFVNETLKHMKQEWIEKRKEND